jgi:tetratricopeptide (TPR) repeat protein
MSEARAMAYRLPIVDAGKEREGCHYVPRLFRNAPGIQFAGRIHENVFASVEEFRREFGLENKLGTTRIRHHGYGGEVTKSRGKVERNLRLLKLALAESPNDANLLMNLGLELARAGELYRGLEFYDRAFRELAKQPVDGVAPEFRETLLLQYCTQLLKANCFEQIVEVLSSPLGRVSAGNASLHFLHGMAAMKLKRWKDAIGQFRACLARRDKPSLTIVHDEIRSVAPKHCLALALAYAKQMDAAAKTFAEAMKEAPDAFGLHYDFAGFLLNQGREVEALQKLHELAARKPDELSVWRAGARIALGRPKFLDVAIDWTTAAHAQHPADSLIATQRAEALLLGGRVAEALPLWREFHTNVDPQHAAALVICESVLGKSGELLPPSIQPGTAREVVQWLKRLVQCGAETVIRALHENVELVRERCPIAADQIAAVFAGAEAAPV